MTLNDTPQDPVMPLQNGGTSAAESMENGTLFDPEIFSEFASLLGQPQAVYWLDTFRDGLKEVCEPPSGNQNNAAKLRAGIHHVSARAGLIGFPALYEACHGYLECRSGRDCEEAAYHRVRDEADRVFPEIERQRAALD